MPAKKVLFIAPRFHTNQFFLTKQLIERQVEVNFLTVYQGGSENHRYLKPIISRPSRLVRMLLRKKDPKIAQHRDTLRKYHITSFVQCLQLYRDLKPEILIIRNLRLFISMQHFLIGLLSGKKIFLYTQNPYRQRISFARSLFYNILKVLGVKHFTPVYGNREDKIIPNTTYIPFVIELQNDELSIKSKEQKSGIHIITIGKMTPRKNIKELVECLNRIDFFNDKKNKLSIVAECISEQNLSYLQTIKNVSGEFHSQLEFRLNIRHKEVIELLKKGDLFILPSHDEPAAFSILEAMACGLAVICSDKNGTQCYIKNGVNGAIFKYEKNLYPLDIILKSILNKQTLIKYGLNSRKIVEESHGVKTIFEYLVNN